MMVFVLFLFFFLGIATCHEVVARLVGRKYKLHLDATLMAGKKKQDFSLCGAFVVIFCRHLPQHSLPLNAQRLISYYEKPIDSPRLGHGGMAFSDNRSADAGRCPR